MTNAIDDRRLSAEKPEIQVEKQYSKTETVISVILPWIQWFHIYAFISGVTIGYVFIVLVDAILLLRKFRGKQYILKFKLKRGRDNRFFFLFIIYVVLALLLIILSGYPLRPVPILNRIVKLALMYGLILACNRDLVNWKAYTRSLKVLSYFACIVLLFQVVSNLVTGSYYNFAIPFLRYTNEDTAARLVGYSISSRFRSIFTEPSHFVYFIFQYIIILVFGENDLRWKRIVEAVVISFCVLLSVSSTGVVLTVLIWVIFFLSTWKKGRLTTRNAAIGLFVLVMMLVGLYIILTNERLRFSIFRMTSDYERVDIVWKRFNANFDDVQNMTALYRFIGYGIGNIESEFMNSYIYGLLNFGIVGSVLILLWLFKKLTVTKNAGRIALFVLIVLGAIDMVFYTPTALGYFIISNHFETRTEDVLHE